MENNVNAAYKKHYYHMNMIAIVFYIITTLKKSIFQLFQKQK